MSTTESTVGQCQPRLGTPLLRLVKEQEEGSCGAEPACHGIAQLICLHIAPGPGMQLYHRTHQSVKSQSCAFLTEAEALPAESSQLLLPQPGDNAGVLACTLLSPTLSSRSLTASDGDAGAKRTKVHAEQRKSFTYKVQQEGGTSRRLLPCGKQDEGASCGYAWPCWCVLQPGGRESTDWLLPPSLRAQASKRPKANKGYQRCWMANVLCPCQQPVPLRGQRW